MVPLIHFVLTWTPSSHREVLDMEIQLFHDRVTEKNPKLLIDHLQRMASGEAPFFPTALSLVYDKLAETAFPKRTSSGPAPGGYAEGESLIHLTPPPQASTITSNIPPPPAVDAIASSSDLQAPASTSGPAPPVTIPGTAWLKCRQCARVSLLRDLRKGLRCPRCPMGGKQKNILMQCASCSTVRGARRVSCEKSVCRKSFM